MDDSNHNRATGPEDFGINNVTPPQCHRLHAANALPPISLPPSRRVTDAQPDPQPSPVPIDPVDPPGSEAPLPNPVELESAWSRCLRSEIQRMPEPLQEVMTLYFLQGLRLPQIAGLSRTPDRRVAEILAQGTSLVHAALTEAFSNADPV